ncbi:hypothetical protein Q7P37_004564 [Cladosporium fusiforme]
MKFAIAIAATNLLTTSASLWDKPLIGHFGVIGGSDGIEGRAFEASRQPNATNSVPLSMGEAGDGEGWTFRVNITEFKALNSTGGAVSPDARSIAITHDLQWPNASMSLNETLEDLSGIDRNPRLCATVLTGLLAPNVTNQYQDSSNGSCVDAIPQKCLTSILSSLRMHRSSSNCGGLMTHDSACAGVFARGANAMSGRIDTAAIPIWQNDDKPIYLNSSDSYYSRISEPYEDGSNTEALQQAKSMLHMAIFTGPVGVQGAVCLRVDASIDDEEVSPLASQNDDDNGNSSDDEEANDNDEDNDESAAVVTTNAKMGLGGLLVLTTMLFTLL